jgi:Protein of unknown function (DUF1761)
MFPLFFTSRGIFTFFTMDSLNWLVISVVTVGNFILGALWFSLFFGKQWMQIHHGDKVPSEAEMAEMSKGMWVLMVSEFIATTLMSYTGVQWSPDCLHDMARIHHADDRQWCPMVK